MKIEINLPERLVARVLTEGLAIGLSFDDYLNKLLSKSFVVESQTAEIDHAHARAEQLYSMALTAGVYYDATVQDLYRKCAAVHQWDAWDTLTASMRKRVGMQFGSLVRKDKSAKGRRVVRVGQTQQNNTLYKTVDN